MFLIFVLTLKIISTESRVFCQDDNSSPWKSLGTPCPITCSTIKTAIDKLQLTDYQYLLNEKISNRLNMSANDLYNLGQQLKDNIVYSRRSPINPETRKHLKLYNTYHRLLNNEDFDSALKKELTKMAVDLNITCSNANIAQYFMKILRYNKCTRKLYKRPDALERFTNFLNKYADPRYQFDQDMVGMILQKLEGNLNLRYGMVDYRKILAYLRKALRYHSTRTNSNLVIRLQSKNCVNLFLPGCYCKTGYVEKEGQCVKPEDCLKNSMYIEYLERIILY